MGYDLENLTLTKEYCWKPWEFVCMCVLMAIEAKRISRGKKKKVSTNKSEKLVTRNLARYHAVVLHTGDFTSTKMTITFFESP